MITRSQAKSSAEPLTYTGAFSSTDTAAQTATQIFSAAANVNGAYVELINVIGLGSSAGGANVTILAKAGAAPASVTDGDAIFKASTGTQNAIQAPVVPVNIASVQRIKIAAGKGLYLNQALISSGQPQHCEKTVLYTLL